MSIEFGYVMQPDAPVVERIVGEGMIGTVNKQLDIASSMFASVWVSDHFMTARRYRLECWTLLTWIAARHPSLGLGTLVLANSYRYPPLLASMAATLQILSQGRLTLGYGAGWYEAEYRAYGYAFTSADERVAAMVDALKLMKASWYARNVTYRGKWYELDKATGIPVLERPPRILIGGHGERALLPAVAEHADVWNVSLRPVAEIARKVQVLKQSCEAVRRDFNTLRKSCTTRVILADTRSEARRLAGVELGRARPPFVGEPAEFRDLLGDLTTLGFDLFQLEVPRYYDPHQLELISAVLASFGSPQGDLGCP